MVGVVSRSCSMETVGTGFTMGKSPEKRLLRPADSFWLERMIMIRKITPKKIRIIRFDNIRSL